MVGSTKSKARSDRIEKAVDLIVLAVGIWFLLNYFTPSLLLSKTTINGGDTCSHNYLAKYMRDYLLPHGKLFGWSPGWWAGFPMFQYYFFMPYLMAALLSYVIPLEIAFKLVTVSGIFTLPLATYLAMRWMGLSFPTPAVGSLLSLLFLFHERQTVWGLNIGSVLSGEISVSISFSAMVLFLGSFYQSVEQGRFRFRDSVLFAFVVFTHMTTALVAGFSSLFFLIVSKRKRLLRNFVIMFKTYALAFLLTAFWTLSIVSKWDYSVGFGEEWSINNLELYPTEAWVGIVFGIYGVVVAFRSAERAVLYLLFSMICSLFLFFSAYDLNLVNIRFWPFHYYSIFALASYGLVMLSENLFSIMRSGIFEDFFKNILPLLTAVTVVLYLNYAINFIGDWIVGNYRGFESTIAWGYYKQIMDLLRGTPGRATNDLSDLNLPIGSSRVFENTPYFNDKPITEGGIVQSGLSSLFTYYIQCESSTHCAGFPRIMTPTTFNLKDGTEHMKLYNIKHFIAVEPMVKNAFKSNSDWKLLGKFGQHEVYELTTNDGMYVYVPKYKPVLVLDKDWKFLAMRWFEDVNNLDTPIAMAKEITAEDKMIFDRTYEDSRVVWSTLMNKQPEFMGEWLVCGTFLNQRYVPYTPENSYNSSLDYGIDISYIDEEDQKPVEDGGCGDGRRWVKYYGHGNGFVDLYNLFETDPEQKIAYVSTYLYSPEDMTVDFWYGSDDGVKLWLNNRLIHVNHVHRGTDGVTDKVQMNLTRGWNLVLLKVENVVSAWGFYAKILDSEGKPVNEVLSRISKDVSKDVIDLRAVESRRDCHISEHLENEEIFFNTSCPGEPHIIKVSYFPNWKVEGSKKIYLVTPDFMLVYPEGNSVRLYYGSTMVDKFGLMVTLIGLLIVVLHCIRGLRHGKNRN